MLIADKAVGQNVSRGSLITTWSTSLFWSHKPVRIQSRSLSNPTPTSLRGISQVQVCGRIREERTYKRICINESEGLGFLTPCTKDSPFFFFGCTGSSCARASHCGDLSCCRVRALGHSSFSRCGTRAPEHRLSSGGPQAQLLHSVWNLSGSGIKPVSPAWADGFLPPGKSKGSPFYVMFPVYEIPLFKIVRRQQGRYEALTQDVSWVSARPGLRDEPSSEHVESLFSGPPSPVGQYHRFATSEHMFYKMCLQWYCLFIKW